MKLLERIKDIFDWKPGAKADSSSNRLPGILSLAKPVAGKEPDYACFEIEADTFYPAMVLFLRGVIQGPRPENAFLSGKYTALLGLRELDFDLIQRTAAEAAEEGKRETRAFVLETARLWFTELLHQHLNGKALGLRILKGTGNFKL